MVKDARVIEILDLSGDALMRGRAFGFLRRAQIGAWMLDWLDSLRSAGVVDPTAYIDRMLRDTDFLPAIREHAPDLFDEVQGIAAGSGQPASLVLASQLMDEEWAFRPGFLSRAEALQKCSSVAIIPRHGPAWIGQNMDLGGYTDGHQLLLRIAPHAGEPGALIFTMGGMIGLLGVNGKGVGVCANSLPQLPSARRGLPVAFVIRKLLQAESAADAAQIVGALPHATGQHYLIADSNCIRSFEVSPAGAAEYHSPDPSRVLHTNHPLAGQDGRAEPDMKLANTIARLQSLTNRLMKGNPGLDSIKAALSSSDDPKHPVCRTFPASGRLGAATETIGFTTGSMISALPRDSQGIESWVSAGPPSLRGYTPVRLPKP